MNIREGSSKELISESSIPRSMKWWSSYYYGGNNPAAHSRTNQSSSSNGMNASWNHFDASCCDHGKKEHHHTIGGDWPERKERFLKSPKSIDENPSRPKKNMLLENDLELQLLLQQLHQSTEFVGTINPLYHSHYLSPSKDHTTTES
jgi:hypothetical protein